MDLPCLQDVEGEKLFRIAKDFYNEDDYITALEVLEDLSFVKGSNKVFVSFLQGKILKKLAEKTEDTDLKFTYLLGSVECFSISTGLSGLAAFSLFNLAQQLQTILYYKKSVRKAKESLFNLQHLEDRELAKKEEEGLKDLLETAESCIAESKIRVGPSLINCKQKVCESKEKEETSKSDSDFVKRLRSYWMGLNVEIKRNFMKVSIAGFGSYVERIYGRKERDALEKVLTSAREDRKWRFWICRCCSKKFFSPEECKNHLEQEHAAEFKLTWTKTTPVQSISKVWARKISVGGWEPVDAVAAVEMIKNLFEDVKAFAYKNGWSREWPLAANEDRSKLLQEIQLLLVSFCDLKILPCSVRDFVLDIVVKHLEKLEVSKHILTECHLLETPQSICFLGCCELNQILRFLKNIKCERDYYGADLVCRAVDSFCNYTRVKEKMDFDSQFLFLLLDKRLLQCRIARFDDEGMINVFDSSVHYAKAHAQGDYMLSWLVEYSSGDESFRFPRPIRAHNLDVWMAVLKAVQFTCRTLGIKYAKKIRVDFFNEYLLNTKNLCIQEDERRRTIPEDRWNTYASLLCDRCEELLSTEARNVLLTRRKLSAVRDVLEGALYPTIYVIDSEKCMNAIRAHKNLSDDIVLKSINQLELAVRKKVPIIDSKILLIENSKLNLLNNLTRVSVFDYRLYILRPLKEFLLDEIVDMESKAKLAAETNSQSKKGTYKSKKRTSTIISSPPDKAMEHQHDVNLQRENTSPSLKIVEEDTMEPKYTLSSERDRMKISSNTDNQQEVIRDLQDMPGDNSLSEHVELAPREGAVRCTSSLDMMLKALCSIKALKKYLVRNWHQFPDNLEEQVPSALRNFFNALVSKQIKEDGVYIHLLRDLMASLDKVYSMSSNAAELLVSILEFWPCWKSPLIENLVTHLFTLEEYERMNCKCRKKPNYPEKSSYGLVMAADSIRVLKCAFGNIKFEDILKLIRMEDKMSCDIKTGGCGKSNFVHHIISRCPPIFTIVLEWEKDETEKEISEIAKALDWEIDISRVYEGLEPNTKYRLVSMIGCGEEEEYICLAFKKNRWVSFRHGALTKDVVGNWKSVVRICGERKIRPEILFYEAARSMM